MLCTQPQFILNFSKSLKCIEAFPINCNIITFSRYLSLFNHIIRFFLIFCFTIFQVLTVLLRLVSSIDLISTFLTQRLFFDSEILITYPYYSFSNSFLSNYNNFFCWSQNMTPTACPLPTRPVILHKMNIKLVWHILFLANVCLPSFIPFIFLGVTGTLSDFFQYFSSNWSTACKKTSLNSWSPE